MLKRRLPETATGQIVLAPSVRRSLTMLTAHAKSLNCNVVISTCHNSGKLLRVSTTTYARETVHNTRVNSPGQGNNVENWTIRSRTLNVSVLLLAHMRRVQRPNSDWLFAIHSMRKQLKLWPHGTERCGIAVGLHRTRTIPVRKDSVAPQRGLAVEPVSFTFSMFRAIAAPERPASSLFSQLRLT